jgi:hypothetical protein
MMPDVHRVAGVVLGLAALVLTSCGSATTAAGCPDGATPYGRRHIDAAAYEAANVELLRSLPLPVTAGPPRELRHQPYTDCADGEGKVAGVVTMSSYPVAEGTAMCAVAEPIEAAFGRDGWSVTGIETDDPTSDGNDRVVSFWRGAAHVTLSVSGAPTSFALSVDHDVPEAVRTSPGAGLSCR